MRWYNFWPPTGSTAEKTSQTLALQEIKFKNSFLFICGWLRTILWRCVCAGAFHLTGALTSGVTALNFLSICALGPMAGTGQDQSNQAQQHGNGSVAQLDRAADF